MTKGLLTPVTPRMSTIVVITSEAWKTCLTMDSHGLCWMHAEMASTFHCQDQLLEWMIQNRLAEHIFLNSTGSGCNKSPS